VLGAYQSGGTLGATRSGQSGRQGWGGRQVGSCAGGVKVGGSRWAPVCRVAAGPVGRTEPLAWPVRSPWWHCPTCATGRSRGDAPRVDGCRQSDGGCRSGWLAPVVVAAVRLSWVVAQVRDLAGLKESGTFPAFAPVPRGSVRHGSGDVDATTSTGPGLAEDRRGESGPGDLPEAGEVTIYHQSRVVKAPVKYAHAVGVRTFERLGLQW